MGSDVFAGTSTAGNVTPQLFQEWVSRNPFELDGPP